MPEKQERPPQERDRPPRKPAREIDVAALTEGAGEVVLLHNGERYRLRITANDKLILTK
jgi:hemin uptake protein HemP